MNTDAIIKEFFHEHGFGEWLREIAADRKHMYHKLYRRAKEILRESIEEYPPEIQVILSEAIDNACAAIDKQRSRKHTEIELWLYDKLNDEAVVVAILCGQPFGIVPSGRIVPETEEERRQAIAEWTDPLEGLP